MNFVLRRLDGAEPWKMRLLPEMTVRGWRWIRWRRRPVGSRRRRRARLWRKRTIGYSCKAVLSWEIRLSHPHLSVWFLWRVWPLQAWQDAEKRAGTDSCRKPASAPLTLFWSHPPLGWLDVSSQALPPEPGRHVPLYGEVRIDEWPRWMTSHPSPGRVLRETVCALSLVKV